MKTTAILSGLLALFLGACSSEPASTSTSPRAAAATDSQAALILDRVPWSGCVATVRGALKIDGVGNVAITQGNREFTVAYDSSKVRLSDLLAALAKAGEPAKAKE